VLTIKAEESVINLREHKVPVPIFALKVHKIKHENIGDSFDSDNYF